MITFVFAKSITAVAAAGLAAFLVSVAPDVKANTPTMSALDAPGAEADLLPARANAAACLAQAWPQYDRSCQFDRRRPASAARTVRVIALR
jgi:hypothetical protein